jgi:hypothetical protein|tara:strand:- start:191 stop:523 length:333 start_codon:yes stop_codon:yes gene_type:complete
MKTVDLDHARVRVTADERERFRDRAVEQPSRGVGAHDDVPGGPEGEERVDDLDLSRGVTEPVPGDVEDDRSYRSHAYDLHTTRARTVGVGSGGTDIIETSMTEMDRHAER